MGHFSSRSRSSSRSLLVVGALGLILIATAACGSQPSPTSSAGSTPPGSEVPNSTPTGAASFMGPVRIVQANGIDIGYRQAGSGKPLLLIMGFSGTMSLWQHEFVKSLVDADFQVTMFDNRGVGYTTDDTSRPLTMQLMAQDTASLIDVLGLGEPTIAGWSMGGEIALTLAGSRPDLVGALVTSGGDAGSKHYIPPTAKAQQVLEHPTDEALLELLFPPSQAAAAQAFGESVALFPQETVSAATLQRQLQAEAAFSRYEGTWANLPNITSPTVIENGALDQITRPENARLIAARIRGAELVLEPDSAHGSLFQNYVKFTRLIVKVASASSAPTP